MKRSSSFVAVVALLAGVLLAHLARPAETRASSPSACGQWEVTSGTPTLSFKQPEDLAKMPIEKAPPGWEPFAIGPNGLVYRRCAR